MDNPEQENEVLSDPEIFEDIPESENKKKEFNPKLVLFFIVVISALGLVFAYSGILTSLKVPFAKIGDGGNIILSKGGVCLKNQSTAKNTHQ